MSNTIVSGRINTFKARSRGELTGGSGTLPGGDPVGSAETRVVSSGGLGVEAETINLDPSQDRV